jgi:GxxExxY protein
MIFDELSNIVIGRALEVHRVLGPGLLENVYKQCLAYELKLLHINFEIEMDIPVSYKNIQIPCGYRADIIINKKIIVEMKSTNKMIPIYEAQLLTYMKLAKIKIGLLINFNEPLLKNGIKRFII